MRMNTSRRRHICVVCGNVFNGYAHEINQRQKSKESQKKRKTVNTDVSRHLVTQ